MAGRNLEINNPRRRSAFAIQLKRSTKAQFIAINWAFVERFNWIAKALLRRGLFISRLRPAISLSYFREDMARMNRARLGTITFAYSLMIWLRLSRSWKLAGCRLLENRCAAWTITGNTGSKIPTAMQSS